MTVALPTATGALRAGGGRRGRRWCCRSSSPWCGRSCTAGSRSATRRCSRSAPTTSATSHHPLLGSWTSASFALGIDVNNPGPLYPDLLAPFMWTFGRAFGIGVATAIGVGTINAAAALGTALVGARIGGWRAERWMLLLVAALTWSMGSELLIDIWQPHALLLPFCALVALTIAVACGDTMMLPVLGGRRLADRADPRRLRVRGRRAGGRSVATAWRSSCSSAPSDGTSRGARSPARRARRSRSSGRWSCSYWRGSSRSGSSCSARAKATCSGWRRTPARAISPSALGRRSRSCRRSVALPPWWTRGGFEDSIRNTPLTDTADGPRLFVPGLPCAGGWRCSGCSSWSVLLIALIVVPAPRRPAAGTHGVHRVAGDAGGRRRRAERPGGDPHRPRRAIRCGGCSRCR